MSRNVWRRSLSAARWGVALACLSIVWSPARGDEAPASPGAPSGEGNKAVKQLPPLGTWTPKASGAALAWLPPQVTFAGVIRPQGSFNVDQYRVLDTIMSGLNSDNRSSFPIKQVEQIIFAFLPEQRPPLVRGTLVFDLNYVRMLKPMDWSAMLAEHYPNAREVEHQGKKYFANFQPDYGTAAWFPDDRTVVIGGPGTIEYALDHASASDEHALFGPTSETMGPAPAAILVESGWFAERAKQISPGGQSPMATLARVLGGMAKETRSLAFIVQPEGDKTAFRVMFSCLDEAGATKRGRGLQSIMTLIGGQAKGGAPSPPAGANQTAQFTDYLGEMLAGATVETQGPHARLNLVSSAPLHTAFAFITTLGNQIFSGGGDTNLVAEQFSKTGNPAKPPMRISPAVLNSKPLVERRRASREYLTKIAAALEKARGELGHYPPAASRDPQGKPLLSWRVHLLPQLGHADLYKQFHLDEAWDSPHNQTLLTQAPAEFSKSALAVVGAGTGFGATEGAAKISDDPASTVLLVEAAEAIPWTKPQDVTIDECLAACETAAKAAGPRVPGSPAPVALPAGASRASSSQPAGNIPLTLGNQQFTAPLKLTGLHPGGVMIALASGEARFVEVETLLAAGWAAFTVAGGEQVALPAVQAEE